MGGRIKNMDPINFKLEQVDNSLGTTGKPFSVVGTEVHGVFMILAWTIFAGISLFTARNGKSVFTSEKYMQKQSWFLIHVGMNMCIFIFTLIATLVIFAARDWKWIVNERPAGSNNSTHAILGITVVSLLGVNFILGFTRPDKQAKFRPLWEIMHSIVGNGASGIGVAAIVMGLNLFRGFKTPGIDVGMTWPAILVIVIKAIEFCFDLVCGYIRVKKIDSNLPKILWYVNLISAVCMGIAVIVGVFY